MNFLGFIYENNKCLYTRNILGEITKVLDIKGNVVIEYMYDRYGNLLNKESPCIYKGYYYDFDVGLYYLNTRYYNPEWGRFFRELGRVVTGVLAVVVGALVIASGVALVPMLIVVGSLTVVNVAADIWQGFSGYNFMRDGVFGGNQTAYNWYSRITEGIAIVGSAIFGVWLKYNQSSISAYKNIGKYEFSGALSKADYMSRPFQSSVLTQQQVNQYAK